MIAAFALGPKQRIPFSSRASTQPKTNGSSGATTAQSILLSTAKDILISEMVLSEGMAHDILDEKIEVAIKESYSIGQNSSSEDNNTVNL